MMDTILFLIVILIGWLLIKFLLARNKDREELSHQNIYQKFKPLADSINKIKLEALGKIEIVNKYSFLLFNPSRNLGVGHEIFFEYSTGHLTVKWSYLEFDKSYNLERKFDYIRDISHAGQLEIARKLIEAFDNNKKLEDAVINSFEKDYELENGQNANDSESMNDIDLSNEIEKLILSSEDFPAIFNLRYNLNETEKFSLFYILNRIGIGDKETENLFIILINKLNVDSEKFRIEYNLANSLESLQSTMTRHSLESGQDAVNRIILYEARKHVSILTANEKLDLDFILMLLLIFYRTSKNKNSVTKKYFELIVESFGYDYMKICKHFGIENH